MELWKHAVEIRILKLNKAEFERFRSHFWKSIIWANGKDLDSYSPWEDEEEDYPEDKALYFYITAGILTYDTELVPDMHYAIDYTMLYPEIEKFVKKEGGEIVGRYC